MNRECICEMKETAKGNGFTEDQWMLIDEIVANYRNKPGALIPVLEEAQEVVGYLPETVQRRVAKGLNVPLSRVYGVVTFYSFFTMKPRGRHQVHVCLGTACHVRGAKSVLDAMRNKLKIEPGECTEGREFSLDVVRCVGACSLAPVMVVDKETYRRVDAAQIDHILEKYREPSLAR
jgi:NADH-quinone oxidoreductase E subunit